MADCNELCNERTFVRSLRYLFPIDARNERDRLSDFSPSPSVGWAGLALLIGFYLYILFKLVRLLFYELGWW